MFKTMIMRMAKKLVIKAVAKELELRKHEIITTINQRVNIPGKTEADEEKIFRAIYDVCLDILRGL